MPLLQRNTAIQLLAALALSTQLTACVPIILGGAAAGGIMAVDRRTTGIYLEDQNIEMKASKQIADNIAENDIHFNLVSYNRNLLLTGEAINETTRTKAGDLAKRIDNVRSLTNELIIGPKTELGSRTNDAFLTSKVKAKILAANRFPNNIIKVVTENSVVYLMGVINHKEGDDAADIARNTEGVQKVVKVFEYVD